MGTINAAVAAIAGASSGGGGSGIARTYLGSVSSEAAMLAISGAVKGDFCLRSDLNQLWELTGASPGVLANWTGYPMDGRPSMELPDANLTLTQLEHAGRTLVFPSTATANRTYLVPNNSTTGGTGVTFEIVTQDGAAFVPTISNGVDSVSGSPSAMIGIRKKSFDTSVVLKASATATGTPIANNLTTNDPGQSLGADQGVALKALVDSKAAAYAAAVMNAAGNLTASGQANRTTFYDSTSDGVLTASTDSLTGASGDESWLVLQRNTGKPSISNGSMSVQGGPDVALGAFRVKLNTYQLWSLSPYSGVPFGASGSGHHVGLVPTPGSSAGTTRFLREDGTWQIPAGSNSQPTVSTLTVENAAPNQAVLTFSAALSNSYVPATTDFPWANSGGSQTVTGVAVSGSTVTLTLSRATAGGEAMACAYPRPSTNALQTAGGELAQAFGVKAVVNNVASLPVVTSASIANATPTKITVDCSQPITSTAPSGAGGFTLTVGGAAMTVTSVAIVGGDIELTCSRPFAAGEPVSLSYVKPGTNNIASAGGELANFSGFSVTNGVAAAHVRMATKNNAPETGDAASGWVYTTTGTPAYSTHNVGDADLSFPANNAGDVWVKFRITRPGGAGNAFYGLDLTSPPGTFTTFKYSVYAPSSGNYQYAIDGTISNFTQVDGETLAAPQDGDFLELRRPGGTGQLRVYLYRAGAPTTPIYLGRIGGAGLTTATQQLWPMVCWNTTTNQAVGPITHQGMS